VSREGDRTIWKEACNHLFPEKVGILESISTELHRNYSESVTYKAICSFNTYSLSTYSMTALVLDAEDSGEQTLKAPKCSDKL
jgi:hypothetical protein